MVGIKVAVGPPQPPKRLQIVLFYWDVWNIFIHILWNKTWPRVLTHNLAVIATVYSISTLFYLKWCFNKRKTSLKTQTEIVFNLGRCHQQKWLSWAYVVRLSNQAVRCLKKIVAYSDNPKLWNPHLPIVKFHTNF